MGKTCQVLCSGHSYWLSYIKLCVFLAAFCFLLLSIWHLMMPLGSWYITICPHHVLAVELNTLAGSTVSSMAILSMLALSV